MDVDDESMGHSGTSGYAQLDLPGGGEYKHAYPSWHYWRFPPGWASVFSLLHLNGIESAVLASRKRDLIESPICAGAFEQGIMDLPFATGAGNRMTAEGALHHGFELAFERKKERT
jgi:hypothetical protein